MHRSFAVNVGARSMRWQALSPAMGGRGRGQIAINASVAGFSGLPTSAAYARPRQPLNNMAESLWLEGIHTGILFQVVNPASSAPRPPM